MSWHQHRTRSCRFFVCGQCIKVTKDRHPASACRDTNVICFFADAYQPVLRSFVHALKDHLNLLRVNLLASVRPLVESNMAGVLPAPGDTISRGGTISSAELTKDILSLNQRMGAQLGLIVNAREAADTIIDQSLPDSPDLAQSTTDDEREPAQDNRRQLQQQQQQQHLDTPFVFRRRQMIQRHQSRNLARIESLLCTVQHDFTHPPIDSKAADAMTNWLSSWLSDIEQILSVEFDERVQDATQSILEDFLVDE